MTLYSCNHKPGIPDSARDVAGATRIMMTKVADCVIGPPYYTAATRKLGRPQHPSPGAGLVLSYPLKSKGETKRLQKNREKYISLNPSYICSF